MISEALIEFLALKHAPPVHPDFVDCDDWHEFARAIEREAYKQGQERMREKVLNGNCSLCHDYVRNLRIEELK